ncbi:uncharacterized protein LOC128212516 [Mya arenaria]|uniref:uncharacterized protein LOC128212516 n=1 Tax=Mya arenaria TaxID=6604 RepID=UPI0022E6A275|nr:uncharacterized protein LOC128212516 [Mya arenaria]
MVLRKVKRQLKLLLIAGVLFIVVVSLKLSLDQTNIFLPFDGSVDLSFRQLLQADKSNIDPKTTQKPQPLVKISDGYNLATRIRDKCAGPASRNSSAKSTARLSLRQPQLGTYRSGGTELCIIWKVGTTFVKRLFMMQKLPKYNNLINPYDISFDEDLQGQKLSIDASSRFMFVRDPYKRLVSAYVDKLLAPNPVYWKIISVKAIRLLRKNATKLSRQCGHDLTFREFIQYVILTLDANVLKTPARPDGHFLIQTDICGPCSIKYDFVGKMESFGVDSLELMRKMKLTNETIDLLKKNGSALAAEDAIKDSCHQPFDLGFKKDYLKCLSFYEALKRAWLKMQMRGLIGPEEMPLTEAQSTTLTLEQFYQMAMQSRNACPSPDRNKMQRDHFLKFFATINAHEMEKIRLIYAQDFNLFEYDDRPSELFHS